MERKQRVEAETLPGPNEVLFYAPVANSEVKQLTIRDRVVRVDDSTYTCTVVLPPVAEAAGLTFQISVSTGTATMTLTDFPNGFGDSMDWTDLSFADDEDQVTLLSTGRAWVIVEDKAT